MKQHDPNLRTSGFSKEKVRHCDDKHSEGTLSISLAGLEVGHTAVKRRMTAIGQPGKSVSKFSAKARAITVLESAEKIMGLTH